MQIALIVWSRHLLERVDFESVALGSPGFADEFVWGEACEGLEASGEVVGFDEVAQVGSQLLVGFVEVAFDSGVLDGAVHPLDLTVGPRMFRLGQPMIDVVLGAGVFEGVRPDRFSGVESRLDVRRGRTRVAWRGEVGSIVGEDGVDLIRDGGDQPAQEVPRRAARYLLMQFDESELRGSIDCDKQVELALGGSNLGDVDMEVSDRIGLELALRRGFAFDLREPGDPMALQTAMKRRTCQMRDGRL